MAAVRNLALNIILSIFLLNTIDPTDYAEFQAVFGMTFTVIIALEFKRSLLVMAQRQDSIVQVRTVMLIALLAIVRKLIILDLSSTGADQLFALGHGRKRREIAFGTPQSIPSWRIPNCRRAPRGS